MKKIIFFVLLTLTAATALPAAAQTCATGSFSVKGWSVGADPATAPAYTGTLTITKTLSEAYKLEWKIGPDTFLGIGSCDATSGTLYVSYANLKAGWFGIVFYDKELKGKWAVAGDTSGKWGYENLTPATN